MREALEIITLSNTDSIKELGSVNLGDDITGEFACSESQSHIAIATKFGVNVYTLLENYAVQKVNSQNRSGEVLTLGYHPLRNILVAADTNHDLHVWDIESNQLTSLTAHTSPIGGLSKVSAEGLVTSVGTWDRTAKVWNIETGALSVSLPDISDGDCLSVDYNPDNEMIAVGDLVGTVSIWNLSGKQMMKNAAHISGVQSISFSSDGRLLASADISDTIKIWDVKTWHEIAEFKHPDGIRSVSISNSNPLAVSSGISDGSIRLWDIYNNHEISHISCGGAGAVVGHLFMDSRLLLSLSSDGLLQIWGIPRSH